jgi:hypothetical protein
VRHKASPFVIVIILVAFNVKFVKNLYVRLYRNISFLVAIKQNAFKNEFEHQLSFMACPAERQKRKETLGSM